MTITPDTIIHRGVEIRKDRDLIGAKCGVFKREEGKRVVFVSPAMFSLLETDIDSVSKTLQVREDDSLRMFQSF